MRLSVISVCEIIPHKYPLGPLVTRGNIRNSGAYHLS